MLAIYHFGPVANSMTPLLGLLEKGLRFEDRYLNSRLWEHHDPAFQKISPEGMVPVLVHDDRVITESTVINEYLDETFPEPPLKPADPYGRARMRIWTKYVDEYFCPALTVLGAQNAKGFASQMTAEEKAAVLARMPNAEVRRKWETVTDQGYSEAELAAARAKLANVARKMEQRLGEGTWMAGDTYSLADIKNYSMAPGLERMLPELVSEQAAPRVFDWLRRMDERPAVKAAKALARPRPQAA
jgi:glutathione S-transferase